MAIACVLHALVIIVISAVLINSQPDRLGAWANTLGIMATILASIQYFPQIYETWSLGHVASLSIPMMCLQTPGSFLWSASLFARLGIEGWSTWGVYLVTGTLQGCLLVMGITFEIRDRKQKQNTEGENVSLLGTFMHLYLLTRSSPMPGVLLDTFQVHARRQTMRELQQWKVCRQKEHHL